MRLASFSLAPPPKNATDSACVRNLSCMYLINEQNVRQANVYGNLYFEKKKKRKKKTTLQM